MTAELTLNFDADYTTRALAIGVKPVREYWTIEQVEKEQSLSELDIQAETMANDDSGLE